MVASLLLVFTMSVPALAAADFEPAYNLLYKVSPAMAQKLKPVSMSCEDNGVKFEVISAYVESSEAKIFKMLSNKQEYDAALTDLDMNQISATPKIITSTHIFGGGGTNYNEMKNNFQALKTTGILCSPVAGVDITAMGYVDGKLHIQVNYENGLETDNHGYIYFKNDKSEEIHCIANVAFSTDSEYQERYVEYVYDLSDVDLAQYEAYGYFVTSDTHIEGNWSVTFPLESISQ